MIIIRGASIASNKYENMITVHEGGKKQDQRAFVDLAYTHPNNNNL